MSYNVLCICTVGIKMNQMTDNLGKITHQITEQGAPIIEQILNKLTGKGASITYAFEDLRVEMPKAEGPDGKQMAKGSLTINGSITITAVLHKKSSNENGYNLGTKSMSDNSRGTKSINDEGLGIQGYSSNTDVINQT
ncbi:hypothetical protein BH23THE1_BH23THE1_30500 [soil metagenome]